MKRFTIVALLLILAGVAAHAQTPAASAVSQTPAAPGTKIAVIDFRSALTESDAGKAAVAQYNKEIEPAKSKFDKAQKDLMDLQTKLQNAKTDAEKSSISRDIDAKKVEFERAQQDAQRTSDDLQQKLLPPVADLVKRMVDQYGKENNLAIVIDPTTDPSNIVFAHKSSDITAEIMRRMNAEFQKNPQLTPPASTVPAAPAKP